MPCTFKWWVQLVGFALRIFDLPWGYLLCEDLRGNVQDALARTSCANQAAQVVTHVRSLGLPVPSAHDGAFFIDKSSFCCHAAGSLYEVWQDLHASPRSAPFKGAKFSTYHALFAHVGPVREPYFQLIMSD